MNTSDILALIAIIVSLACVGYEAYSSKKINRINIENKYYAKIFDNILLFRIPKAREYLMHIGDNLEGTQKLQSVLVDLRKKALFFKYKDLDFYNDLTEMCMNIEDYLFNCEGEMTKDTYKKFERELDSRLADLYTLISDNSEK